MIRQEKENGLKSPSILKKARTKLKEINPDNSLVKQSLEEVYLNKKKAQYLIVEIGNKAQSATKAIAMGKTSLEHIYPEKAKKEDWPKKNDLDPLVWHIGNLTLLEPKLNKNIGNKPYSDKTTEYVKSEIELTKKLPSNYSDWNVNSIVTRAKSFATILNQIWQIP